MICVDEISVLFLAGGRARRYLYEKGNLDKDCRSGGGSSISLLPDFCWGVGWRQPREMFEIV
jgi:hypothetical protein